MTPSRRCPRCGDLWTDHGGFEDPICREPSSAHMERIAIVDWLWVQVSQGTEVLDEMDPDDPSRVAMQVATSTILSTAQMIEEGAHHAK